MDSDGGGDDDDDDDDGDDDGDDGDNHPYHQSLICDPNHVLNDDFDVNENNTPHTYLYGPTAIKQLIEHIISFNRNSV